MNIGFLIDLQRLRHWCPPPRPTIVHRVRQHDSYGTFSWRDDGKLIVTIRIEDDPREERETLIHEWAHALTYDESRPKQRIPLAIGGYMELHDYPLPMDTHDSEWGIAYARCYRAVQIPVTSEFGPDVIAPLHLHFVNH